ncbi:MAG: phage terminase large subunit family protein, partial [Undibacterium sp.]|nr:phage terminase large subunit family protein [Opitutaceae bacterium]
MSKPVRWASAHHCEVATGTLSVNLVPCPHCGAYQELTVDGRSLVDQLRIEKPLRPGQPPLNPPLAYVGTRLGRLDYSTAKLLDGTWDLAAIDHQTVYLCVSGCRIRQDDPLPAEVVTLALGPESDLQAAIANPQSPLHLAACAAASLSPEVITALRDGRRFTCKPAMTLSGAHHWLRTNPRSIPHKRSRHISDLHSLDDDMTWGIFARGWVVAQSDPAKIKTYLNEHFGLPAREKAADITEDHILELRAPYARGTLPFRPDIIVTSADTQDAYWKYVTLAAQLDSAGKNYARLAVLTWGIATSKAELIAILATPFSYTPPTGDVETFSSVGGLVDAGGHRTDEVYELHFESGFRYFGSYGRSSPNLVTPTWERQIKWRTVELKIYMYDDDAWKRRLYLGSISRSREIKDCLAAHLDPDARQLPALLLTPGAVQDKQLAQFEAELQGERLNEDGEWERVPGTLNDFGDALKTARISLDLRLAMVIAHRAREKAEAAAAAAKK